MRATRSAPPFGEQGDTTCAGINARTTGQVHPAPWSFVGIIVKQQSLRYASIAGKVCSAVEPETRETSKNLNLHLFETETKFNLHRRHLAHKVRQLANNNKPSGRGLS